MLKPQQSRGRVIIQAYNGHAQPNRIQTNELITYNNGSYNFDVIADRTAFSTNVKLSKNVQ